MNAIGPVTAANLVFVSEQELVDVLARTPLDQHLIWNGRARSGRPNSILTTALTCVHEVWTPIPLRSFLQRAARIAGSYGVRPEALKKSLWSHQSATPASYLLVRAVGHEEYVAITDVPRPSSWNEPIRRGDVVMNGDGRLDLTLQSWRPHARLSGAPPERLHISDPTFDCSHSNARRIHLMSTTGG